MKDIIRIDAPVKQQTENSIYEEYLEQSTIANGESHIDHSDYADHGDHYQTT